MQRNLILQLGLVLVALLIGSAYLDDSSPTVTIAQGTLVGRIYNTTYGSYYAFQGIPYAKPPVGNLRFRAPVPAEPWDGTFQAVQEGSQCVQTDLYMKVTSGDEDCLFVNVYTPQNIDPNNLLPVMVWIHGGGYYEGNGNIESQGPEFLLDAGVIYVSLNYRLSALGFLSTQDDAAPGNAGMKDQVLALQWVQQNIAAFGGDPEQVTIFGCSAGGASVSLQIVSPMSAGLFRSAIPESGSAVNGWSIYDQEDARPTAFHLGNVLGYTGNSSRELVDYLRTLNAADVVEAALIHAPEYDQYRLVKVTFVPVVEANVEGEDAFLPESPVDLLAQGKFNDVSVLTGSTSAEGTMFLYGNGMLGGSVSPEEINRNFSLIFKPELRYCRHEACGDEMIAKIKSFYFGDEGVTSDNLQNLINMVTDLFFAEGVLYAVDKLSAFATKPVYFYQFTYVGGLSGTMPSLSQYPGAYHCGEGQYLFNNGQAAAPESTDALVRQELAEMWSNFAITGNPTPDGADNLVSWLPYSSSATNYLDIGAQLDLKTDFNKDRMDFWRELYGSA